MEVNSWHIYCLFWILVKFYGRDCVDVFGGLEDGFLVRQKQTEGALLRLGEFFKVGLGL